MYRSVLVPLDGSAFAEQALPLALGIARRAGATLDLVSVQVPFPPVYGEGMTRLENPLEAQAYLDRVAERLRAASLPVQTRVVFHEHPAVAILNAHAHDIDLIAFTTRGHRALPWLFLGSTADKVLRGASTPVLVQRPRDPSIPEGGFR